MAGSACLEGFSWRPVGRRGRTVDGLDLRIAAGERVLLVGASGSGKSTVLHALVGALGTTLSGETAGSVRVDGRIGLVSQNPADSIVAERIGRDVAFGPENLGLDRRDIWRRVEDALAAVELDHPVDRRTSALSGGERQRLALAGALALRPDLLLLDEPTAMLDEQTAAQVRAAVVRAAAGRTMVVVEHRFEPWLEHVDRVVVLGAQGRVEYDGSVAGLLAGPDRPGLWMPGRPAPVPRAVEPAWVRPDRPGQVSARAVEVTVTSRGLRGTTRALALRGFDVDLVAGTSTALTGPSGAGKSTALLALAGLVEPTAGRIVPRFSQLRSRDLARRVGWLPQDPELGFCCDTVRAEVERTSTALGGRVDPMPLLDFVGLAGMARSHPYRLSGGEQRRLALVAALAHRPGVVLLDEPTVGQDPQTWATVAGWYVGAAAAGAAVALSTHDVQAPRDAEVRLGAVRETVA